MLRTSKRRGIRRVATAIPIAAVAFAATNLTGVAHATLIASSTTLTTTPSGSAGVGQSVTLKATVSASLVAPSGSVQFKVGTAKLGAAQPVGNCSGTTCTASLSTSALPQGHDALSAVYSGGGLVAGSTSPTVYIDVVPVTTTTGTSSCTEGVDCDSGTTYSGDLSASLRVQTHGGNVGGGNYTIQKFTFGGPTLTCQTITDGAAGNYDVSTNDVLETITYQLVGHAADESHAANPTNVFDECLGYPVPFTTNTGGTSAFNTSSNEYEGIPQVCNATHSNTPCQSAQNYAIGNGPGGANTVTFVLIINAGTTAGGNGNGNTCTHHQGQPQNCNAADPRPAGG